MSKDRDDDRPRKGRKVRIDLRKNRGKVARDGAGLTRRMKRGDESVDDEKQNENVRAKGDLSRKRTIIIQEEGEQRTDLHDGVVVAMRGLMTEVDDGVTQWACTVRRMMRTRMIGDRQSITVGDRVRIAPVFHNDVAGQIEIDGLMFAEGVIEEVEERESVLVREYERKRQVIAANVDTVVITVAANQPTLRPHLIDRYLVSVHKGEMRPVVCINKADLDEDGTAAAVAERYRAIGYRALLVSVEQGVGLEPLRETIRDKTSVFVGPSGVGKSSIINALAPDLRLKVGTVSDVERGRHTTTMARLLKWPFGGYVVDTPGMRQFELAGVEAGELEAFFTEFVELLSDCKFKDCTHTHEIGCAIKEAVEDGRITPERYDSYCKMIEEIAARGGKY